MSGQDLELGLARKLVAMLGASESTTLHHQGPGKGGVENIMLRTAGVQCRAIAIALAAEDAVFEEDSPIIPEMKFTRGDAIAALMDLGIRLQTAADTFQHLREYTWTDNNGEEVRL